MRGLVPDELLDRIAVRGTPEECAAELDRRFGDLAGRVCAYFPRYDPALDAIAALVEALS